MGNGLVWGLVGLAAIPVLALAAMTGLQASAPRAPVLVPLADEQQMHVNAGAEQGSVRFQNRGQGTEATVLLHGFNGQMADWNKVWGRIEGCGRTIRLDLPGFGGSVWPTDDFGLPAQAHRLSEFLDALGVERVTLVGASMGGSLAAWFAAHHPQRVRGVLLLAPSGYPDSLHYNGLYGAVVKPGLPNRLALHLARSGTYKAMFPSSRLRQAASVTATYGEPWKQALGRIEAPALLVWSRGDASFHAAEAVTAAIKTARLMPVGERAGHLLPATEPGLTAAAICRLAEGVSLDEAMADLRRLPAD